ncbi:MAG: Na/Pi symporter, partial [Oscillospiraceae bacterium]|nr:Na/Pi symporter [Oscillospiraceae bacterium]
MKLTDFLALFGGLAFFLYGMFIMSSSLEKMAGGKLERILRQMTSGRLRGFFLGVGITAIIQSSSAVTVMLVGFVNSGIMELWQSIGVIIGANIGTTMTGWITSLSGIDGDSGIIALLKPEAFSPILAFIGILLVMLAKSSKKKDTGNILLGFALLLTGMSIMSAAVKPLRS